MDLHAQVSSEFTLQEKAWHKQAFTSVERNQLIEAIASTSLGGKKTEASPVGPVNYWGPLSHPKVPVEIKRKLFARGLEIITSPIERHFLLLNALEPRNEIVSPNEKHKYLWMFITNRPIAAHMMDQLGSSRPPNMGDNLIVNPLESDWPTYEKYFFELKYDFSKLEQWKQVRKVWYEHIRLDQQIASTYRQRDEIGIESTIPLCRDQIAIAKDALQALPQNHNLEFEYHTELRTRYLKARGRGPSEGWMPEYRSYTLPVHRGFKQLSIIFDKKRDYRAAIDVCNEALSVGWPGDWESRRTRYQRKLDKSQGRS